VSLNIKRELQDVVRICWN